MLTHLDSVFYPHGFTRVSDSFYGDAYHRPISGGRQSVAIDFRFSWPGLILNPPYVSITLDQISQLVAQYEEPHPLIGPNDIAQRSTIGHRLHRRGVPGLLGLGWAIWKPAQCAKVADAYGAEVISRGIAFWNSCSTPEVILNKLSGDPVDVRNYAQPDHSAAARAIILTQILHGHSVANAFAEERISRLTGTPKRELSAWLQRYRGQHP